LVNNPVSNTFSNKMKTEVGRGRWFKDKILPLLSIIFVIAISVALFLFRERVSELNNYGYLGAFLISLIANATVILPMPGLLILIALGAAFNPILVALAGAIGGALGEMTGYVLGRSGRGITSQNKWYTKADYWMKRRGFLTVFLFALLPFLPLDIAGLIAGVSRFSIWKFLLACFLGKAVLYIIMIQTGTWGWEAILRFFS
jgi:uncharacterized membrane protein YdjX (TVP38/TMEM64 family)